MPDWKVILPESGTNYCLNPTAMGSSDVTAVTTGTPTKVTTYSYLGYKCHRLVTNADNSGAYYALSTLANAIHYVTLRIHTASDIATFDVSLDNSNFNTMTLLKTEGDWYVYGYQFPAAQANASTKLYILQKGDQAGDQLNLYIGHIQVEQNTYATTPITGDIKGFCSDGYYWNGTPNASSSTRAAKERSGGVEKDLDSDYSFKVRYGLGSGMPPITHHVQGQALLPGSLYQGHRVEPRVLDLMSAVKAKTAATVSAARKNFINAVKPDRVSPEQPVVFVYYGVNSVKPVKFYGYYDSGMEFQLSDGIIDQPTARFICYDPFCYEFGTGSAVLTTSATSDADSFIAKVNGAWDSVSTALNNTIYQALKGADGSLYLGGAYTDVGDANGDYIVKWNPYSDALSSLGGGADASIETLIAAPNGNIYAGGAFTHVHTAAGAAVANTNKIACWTLNSATVEWIEVGGGITCASADVEVKALAFDHAGSLYVGGLFADQADANGDNITKYTLTSATVEYVSLGTGCNGKVNTLATAPNGDIYAGGAFTLAGGVSGTAYIAYWDINPDTATAEWQPLGTGISGGTPVVNSIVFDKAGNLYVAGNFTTCDGVSCLNIAKWNGKTFEPLGSGLNATVNKIAVSSKGLLYAVGSYTGGGPDTPIIGIAVWNGTCWAHLDLYFPVIVGAQSVYVDEQDNIYLGFAAVGAALTSYLNTVTNNGSAESYPIIKINRANDGTTAVVEWIKNETTGDTLWLNYGLMKGETLTIDLTPGSRTIKSDYAGEVWRAVLRSSDLSAFRLLPGTNKISVFVNPTGAPTITAWAEWPATHWAADTVAA